MDIDKINNLSFDDKIKVWLDYVVTICLLNNDKPIIDVLYFNEFPKYPVFGCYYGKAHNIKIESFDDFIDESKNIKVINYPQTGLQKNYTGIYDWHSKFEERIFNNKIE